MDDKKLYVPDVKCRFCAEALTFEHPRAKPFADYEVVTGVETEIAHAFYVTESPSVADPALSYVRFLCDAVFPIGIREETSTVPSTLIPTLELSETIRKAGESGTAEDIEAHAVFSVLLGKGKQT